MCLGYDLTTVTEARVDLIPVLSKGGRLDKDRPRCFPVDFLPIRCVCAADHSRNLDNKNELACCEKSVGEAIAKM